MARRIHIFGASGSGTTTLGIALGEALQVRHLDTDRYYWKLTDPPFTEKNDPSERVRLIESEIAELGSWVLSGSLCGWGDPLIQHFTLAVFLKSSPSVRMARLRARESQRYGDRILAAGDMHRQYVEFMAWAQSYDSASTSVRSLVLHEQWMKRLGCPVLHLDSDRPVEALVEEVTKCGPVAPASPTPLDGQEQE